MAERILLAGGEVIDEEGRRRADVLVEGGQISACGEVAPPGGAEVVDVTGCLVAPGLVDMHTHLREPGGEQAETVASGAAAAALGGYTAVVAMANTDPVADCVAVIDQVRAAAASAGLCEVHPAGAITAGLEGAQLAPVGELAAIGVRLFSDDGRCLGSAELMRRALEYARPLGVLIANHAEERDLTGEMRDGSRVEFAMNEGPVASRLGLSGRPRAAESVIVARDLLLAEYTGGRLHVPHVSTAESVELIRVAKSRGVSVSAEVTPHHLTLTDEACESYDPVLRVNPPLRTARDIEALRAGLADGTIDVIATDHAPHPPEEKEKPFDQAPPGMTGLETALGVILTDLVGTGVLSLEAAIAAMSWKPARLLGLVGQGGPIQEGAAANLVVIDHASEWTVDAGLMASASANTPFAGRRLRGRARHTVLRGRFVLRDGAIASGGAGVALPAGPLAGAGAGGGRPASGRRGR